MTTRAIGSSILVVSLLLAACGGGGGGGGGGAKYTPAPPPISVSVTSANVQVNGTQQLTATVSNDPANRGVTWTLTQSGTACSKDRIRWS